MPHNPYADHHAQLTRRGLELFVGREIELQTLRRFVEAWSSGNSHERLTHVFGPAGTGKSSLLAKLRTEFSASPVRLAVLDVDADAFDPNTPAPDLLWRLRFALRMAGVRTPLYDLFYPVYFGKHVLPGMNMTLSDLLVGLGAKSEPVEKASSAASSKGLGEHLAHVFDAEFFTDVADAAGELAKGIKGVQLFVKLAGAFRKKAHRRALKNQGIDISTADAKDMQSLAPEILASDLVKSASSSKAVVVVVDGFDRIQSESRVLREPGVAESALEALVRYVMFSGDVESSKHVGFLFFSRQRLRWSELFDQGGHGESWDAYVRQLPLRGLERTEAMVFLSRADRMLDTAGETVAAQALRASTQAVLSASREQAAVSEGDRDGTLGVTLEGGAAGQAPNADAVRYSPFRLRLCVEEIGDLKRAFSDDDARQHADDICASFLRSVSRQLRDAVYVFALAGEIDAAMFEALVRLGVIAGFAITDFPLLVQRDALFTRAIGNAEAYRLHFQLEDAALGLLAKTEASRQVAVAATTGIFNEYVRRATSPTFVEWTKAHLDTYQQAMRLVFRIYESRLLPIDRFAMSFLELEETLRFDTTLGGTLHAAWFERLFERSSRWTIDDGQRLVDSQLLTRSGKRARQIIQLMILLFHTGTVTDQARAAAKTMFTRMYSAGVFPPKDGALADTDTLTAIEVQQVQAAAGKLTVEGKFAEAEAVLEQCLRALSPALSAGRKAAHEGDLNRALAQVAVAKRDKGEVEARFDRALTAWRAADLEGMAFAERALDYCMAMISLIGKEDPAEILLREIAPVLERGLPPMHPARADLATTFAMLCMHKGLPALAMPYLIMAKQVLGANYGADHPRVVALQSFIDIASRDMAGPGG